MIPTIVWLAVLGPIHKVLPFPPLLVLFGSGWLATQHWRRE